MMIGTDGFNGTEGLLKVHLGTNEGWHRGFKESPLMGPSLCQEASATQTANLNIFISPKVYGKETKCFSIFYTQFSFWLQFLSIWVKNMMSDFDLIMVWDMRRSFDYERYACFYSS